MVNVNTEILICGDNLEIMEGFPGESVDLVYIDPPFFTGKKQTQLDRTLSVTEGSRLSFNDIWADYHEYINWVKFRLEESRRLLKPTGSVYLHCDWHASHLLRLVLDDVLGPENFRAEIIWHYKRWTNVLRSFQKAHQTIFFYSKSGDYKFNIIYEDYSLTTNIDQIWQKRARDRNNKCITAKGKNGDYEVLGKDKLGVPLRDVWEIPYLNPKAKERTGWPTQKPLELLRRIILASTDEGDTVLDPVCGSGTTLVAAKALRRNRIGIDISEEAIKITKKRLSDDSDPFAKTKHYIPYKFSRFMKLDRTSKIQYLASALGMNIVLRNANLDGFLKRSLNGSYVGVRYIEKPEPLEAVAAFIETAKNKKCETAVIIIPEITETKKEVIENTIPNDINTIIITIKDILTDGFNLEGVLDERRPPRLFE